MPAPGPLPLATHFTLQSLDDGRMYGPYVTSCENALDFPRQISAEQFRIPVGLYHARFGVINDGRLAVSSGKVIEAA